jgi:hypothetical protein
LVRCPGLPNYEPSEPSARAIRRCAFALLIICSYFRLEGCSPACFYGSSLVFGVEVVPLVWVARCSRLCGTRCSARLQLPPLFAPLRWCSIAGSMCRIPAVKRAHTGTHARWLTCPHLRAGCAGPTKQSFTKAFTLESVVHQRLLKWAYRTRHNRRAGHYFSRFVAFVYTFPKLLATMNLAHPERPSL